MTNTPENASTSQKATLSLAALTAAYACFFLATLWAAYGNHLPLTWLSQFSNYDKLGHLVLYCIPTYLGHRLCKQKHFKTSGWMNSKTSSLKNGILLPVFPALFFLFAVTEELAQGFSPYRTLDADDLLCSFLGISAGYWLAQRSKI